jgi:hypothetical protein
MLKNITLSAEHDLIEQARARAAAENTTLNAEFRRWLVRYVQRPHSADEFLRLMSRLDYVQPGGAFSREEMNER